MVYDITSIYKYKEKYQYVQTFLHSVTEILMQKVQNLIACHMNTFLNFLNIKYWLLISYFKMLVF